ncbi:MAG: hypothetical protein LBM74_06320 [Oscillospiraceae bacterium]|jgi:hypothetical protein|nr:hypothetical protein [Oscillospiraceae bacterium]
MITALCLLLSAAIGAAPLPADALTARLILTQVAQDGAYQRSESRTDPGQCRRFQANGFAKVAAGYELAEYPGVPLYLPEQHADEDEVKRALGTCWGMPAASTGNAFVEVASFDFKSSRTTAQNRQAAEEFLSHVRAGDILQMVATYQSGGRGTHTLLFTRPYDARRASLHWVDSNFDNRRVDGVRYGYVHAYQERTVADLAKWISAEYGNGATLYRVSGDVVEKEEE